MRNFVQLEGNLGKDPEYRKTSTGVGVVQFSIATNEPYKDKDGEWQQTTTWHTIKAWRRVADQVFESYKKGSLVMIEGHLREDVVEKDGEVKRYRYVLARKVIGLQMPEKKSEAPAVATRDEEPMVPDDDLPF